MISPAEKIQIRSFLLSKKLPIDILLEVQDHFEDQVDTLREEKDMLFQEAFLLTQTSWAPDLRLVKKSFFSFGRVPNIVKEIQKKTQEKLIMKSSVISVILLFSQLLTARLMVHEYYLLINMFIYLLIGLLILEMTLVYIFSKMDKKRTRAELYFNNQLLNIFLFYIILGMFGVFTKLPTNFFKVIYDSVNGINEFSVNYFYAALVSTLFERGVTFYLYFMLKDRSRSIHQIKAYRTF